MKATFRLVCLVFAPLCSFAAIMEISIPEQSQNNYCRPYYDSVWRVTAPPYPLNLNLGIGIIVNPSFVSGNDHHDFALHQNDGIQPSPYYSAPYVPDPTTANVTYVLSTDQIISGVEIIQHINGITKVEGFLGASTNSLVSLGAVFGPSGDVLDSFVVPNDGVSQKFYFGNTNVSGRVFKLVIRKTNSSLAFATHRIFLLGEDGQRIPTAVEPPIVVTIAPSAYDICWNSVSNATYQVQYRSTLTTNMWVDFSAPVLGNGATNCVTDTTSGQSQRYYQVVRLP